MRDILLAPSLVIPSGCADSAAPCGEDGSVLQAGRWPGPRSPADEVSALFTEKTCLNVTLQLLHGYIYSLSCYYSLLEECKVIQRWSDPHSIHFLFSVQGPAFKNV